MSIDKLHADAVCALGLYLHGNAKTDRALALRTHEGAVDALASEASRMITERDATIAGLSDMLGAFGAALVGLRAECHASEEEGTIVAAHRALRERDARIAQLEAAIREALALDAAGKSLACTRAFWKAVTP